MDLMPRRDVILPPSVGEANLLAEIKRLADMLHSHGIDPRSEFYRAGVRVNPPKENGHNRSCECPDCTPF